MECFGEVFRTEWRIVMTILIDQTTGIIRDSNDLCKTKDEHIEISFCVMNFIYELHRQLTRFFEWFISGDIQHDEHIFCSYCDADALYKWKPKGRTKYSTSTVESLFYCQKCFDKIKDYMNTYDDKIERL